MNIKRKSWLARLICRFTSTNYLYVHVDRYNKEHLVIKPGPDFWYINGSIVVFVLIGVLLAY